MQAPDPANLLRLYDKGHITEMELHTGLVRAAAVHSPEDIAPLLTVKQVQAVREFAASPPSSLEACPRTFHMGSWVGPYDWEADDRAKREQWYDGVWRWHRYFEGESGRTKR
jgi:hypothetical protein